MSTKPVIFYFTKYTSKGPSSRYRSYQYRRYLEDDFDLKYFPLFNDDYFDRLNKNERQGVFHILKAYLLRIVQALKCLGTDKIVFIEYELLPYFPPILECLLHHTRVKMIVDYDDAIFHNYDMHNISFVRVLLKRKIPYVAKKANFVITGSPYLSLFFSKYNANVIEIPTSVIFEKYQSISNFDKDDEAITIGWVGSKTTSINIIYIREVIERISSILPDVTFKFMGFDNNLQSKLNFPNVSFFNWSEIGESLFLSGIDLGIMPLQDTPSNRGKCGFKLIQYMAVGKPTLSTPLEANLKINRDSANLFATNIEEWVNGILEFSSNLSFYRKVGILNRDIIKSYYSVESNAAIYSNIFKQLGNVRN